MQAQDPKIIPLGALIRLARLDRPVGIYLLLAPCWWGLALGQSFGSAWIAPINTIYQYALFAVGALLLRSVGCIYNDWVDRKYDIHVARTRNRPLATGEVTSLQAFVTAVVLCLCALAVFFQLTLGAQMTSLLGFFMMLVYPWTKRITNLPQLWLGFTFNIGVWAGWFTTQPFSFSLKPLLVYLVGVLWTLGYDTLYAFADYEDDKRQGIKSMAQILGHATSKKFFIHVYGCMYFVLNLLGSLEGWGMLYALLLFTILTFSLVLVCRTDVYHPDDCLDRFRDHHWLGWMIWLAIGLGSA